MTVPQLKSLLDQVGSVFVFDARGAIFWNAGIDAYPMTIGTLLVRTNEDEIRFPMRFATAVSDRFVLHQSLPNDRKEEFLLLWHHHLAGIVEYRPTRLVLPPHAFPPADI